MKRIGLKETGKTLFAYSGGLTDGWKRLFRQLIILQKNTVCLSLIPEILTSKRQKFLLKKREMRQSTLNSTLAIGAELSGFLKEDARLAKELDELFRGGEETKDAYLAKQSEHSRLLGRALDDGVITEHYSRSRALNIASLDFFVFPALNETVNNLKAALSDVGESRNFIAL